MKKILPFISTALVGLGAFAASTPQFPGGQEALDLYISQNIVYPETAKTNGIEGIVGLKVTILPDGTVGPIKVVRMVDPDLEQEAIRLAKKMPKWIPADKDGTPVEAPAEMKVPFILPE